MRVLVLFLAAAVAACAPSRSEEQVRAERERHEREAARILARTTPEQRQAGAAAVDAELRRAQQARAICAARAEMAGATYSGRGFGLAGALSAGVEAGIAAERVRAACLDAWQRTGVMPSL